MLKSGSSAPWSERDIDQLQALLDRIPAPLEPLDVSMLDGFLCGVLLQPRPVPEAQWLPHVADVDGRTLPPKFDAHTLHQLVRRRHADLNEAIGRRLWFDPWVFEMDSDESTPGAGLQHHLEEDDDAPPTIDAVYPWVAGFATAVELFPGLMQLDEGELTEPLALLYRHLDPDDLEDADALLAEIETLEPPEDLAAAVEELVRATLLLADVSRPVASKASTAGHRPARPRPPGTARRR
ncbi:MAG: YecA family protein [Rhizobacter sp.]